MSNPCIKKEMKKLSGLRIKRDMYNGENIKNKDCLIYDQLCEVARTVNEGLKSSPRPSNFSWHLCL